MSFGLETSSVVVDLLAELVDGVDCVFLYKLNGINAELVILPSPLNFRIASRTDSVAGDS